jgi:hypothetical protein
MPLCRPVLFGFSGTHAHMIRKCWQNEMKKVSKDRKTIQYIGQKDSEMFSYRVSSIFYVLLSERFRQWSCVSKISHQHQTAEFSKDDEIHTVIIYRYYMGLIVNNQHMHVRSPSWYASLFRKQYYTPYSISYYLDRPQAGGGPTWCSPKSKLSIDDGCLLPRGWLLCCFAYPSIGRLLVSMTISTHVGALSH